MKRRVALKNLALAAGGLIALPAWATGWNKVSVQPETPFLPSKQAAILAEIVETVIPATDTPGAKDLEVHTFVQRMVADCYEKEVQDNIKNGLDKVDQLAKQTYNQAFVACNPTQRLTLLQNLTLAPEQETKDFFTLVKKLTIQGYTTSEYYLMNHTNYKMVPGHYYGCVPAPVTTTSTK